MSDPLTALMHAVQVMNLLKTLITKTLRERDEACDGGYSPLSSHSSERQTDEEYDSQQETDTSCESTGLASDDDEQAQYSPCSKDRDEVESLSEIEECFLRQLDENESAKNGFRKQLEGILSREHVSPASGCSPFNADSCPSLSDSRIGSSFLSTSDGEDSRISSIASGPKMDKESIPGVQALTGDLDMVDNVVESVISKQLCVPNASV